jgi:hypothetical protein
VIICADTFLTLSSIRVIEDDRAAGARIDLGGLVCHQVTQDDPALRILRFQIPCRFDSDLAAQTADHGDRSRYPHCKRQAASACWLTLFSAISVSVASVFFSSAKVASSSLAALLRPSSEAQVLRLP